MSENRVEENARSADCTNTADDAWVRMYADTLTATKCDGNCAPEEPAEKETDKNVLPPLEIYGQLPVVPGDRPFKTDVDNKPPAANDVFASAKKELSEAYNSREKIRGNWTTKEQSDAAEITKKIDDALQKMKVIAKDATPAEMNKLIEDLRKDNLLPLVAVQWAQEQMGAGNHLMRKDMQSILDKSADPKNGKQALDQQMAKFFLEQAKTGDPRKDALGHDNFYYFSQGQSSLKPEETRVLTRTHAKNIVAGTDQAERR